MTSRIPLAGLVVCLSIFAADVAPKGGALPGMPPVLDSRDIYSADHAGNLSPVVRNFPHRIYVPNTESNTVSVIDPPPTRSSTRSGSAACRST